MSRKHVAIVLPGLLGGGAERISLILAQEFVSRGLEISLVLMREQGELLPYVTYGVRIV
jgi:hypothetical protein